MSTMTIEQQQAPSLSFDGNTVTVGDLSFDVTMIDKLTGKVRGGLITGHRVVWTVTTLDGRRHEVTLPPSKTAETMKRVQAVLDEQRKAREASAERELDANAERGTVTIVGQSFPAVRRPDGQVTYTDRQGNAHKAVGPHRKSFRVSA